MYVFSSITYVICPWVEYRNYESEGSDLQAFPTKVAHFWFSSDQAAPETSSHTQTPNLTSVSSILAEKIPYQIYPETTRT